MILPDAQKMLDDLAASCEYDRESGDGTIDALIEYKNALEDELGTTLRKAAAWDRVDEVLVRNARGESHASAADVCAVGFALQEALR